MRTLSEIQRDEGCKITQARLIQDKERRREYGEERRKSKTVSFSNGSKIFSLSSKNRKPLKSLSDKRREAGQTSPNLKKTRLKPVSHARERKEIALRGIKLLLAPFVKRCIRCEEPNPAGSGFESKSNPQGLDAHHIGRRVGLWFFVIVPVCRRCHDEIHANEDRAHREGWILRVRLRNQS